MPKSERSSDHVIRMADWPVHLANNLGDADPGVAAVLDQMRDGLLLIDTARGEAERGGRERQAPERLIYVNDAALEILGRGQSEPQAKRLDELLAKPVVEALRQNSSAGHSGVVESEQFLIYGPLRI